MKKIRVIDAPMGSGKTSGMIKYMEQYKGSQKLMFITPYLSEIEERIQPKCPKCNFKTPEQKFITLESGREIPVYTKGEDIKKLLKAGENIATTHALFHNFDLEIEKLIREQGYNLIMDESIEVVLRAWMRYFNKRWDMRLAMTLVELDEQGFLKFKDECANYDGDYLKFKEACDRKAFVKYADDDPEPYWIIPKTLFTSFTEIYIMTYGFYGQLLRCYIEFIGYNKHCGYYKFKKWGEDGIALVEDKYKNDLSNVGKFENMGIDLKSKITLLDFKEGKEIGDESDNALSHRWCGKKENIEKMAQLPRNIRTIIRRVEKIEGRKVDVKKRLLWTTFKDVAGLNTKGKCEETTGEKSLNLKVKFEHKDQFVSCNIRATNKYAQRDIVVYACNRYLNPAVKNILGSKIHVDEGMWALCEMIQFIWRSAIRNGEHIYLYIPSRRMRKLFEDWLDQVSI